MSVNCCLLVLVSLCSSFLEEEDDNTQCDQSYKTVVAQCAEQAGDVGGIQTGFDEDSVT